MNSILANKRLLFLLNFITISVMFLFLMSRLKYAVVINDDMNDIITQKFYIPHSRFITGCISQLFVKIIPMLLGINFQDFALISEGILKTLFFIFLVFISNLNKYFQNKILGLCVNIFNWFVIFSILFKCDFVWCFDTLEWFFGYIVPVVFYFLFWYKFMSFYLAETPYDFQKKDYFILFILSALVVSANEEVNFAFFILLIMIIFENVFLYFKYKKINSVARIAFISILFMFIFMCFVYFSFGIHHLWNGYNLSISLNITKNTFLDFISLFYENIIYDNIVFICLLVLSIIIILNSKENKNQNYKVVKYVVYSIIGFVIFLFATIFLPPNCYVSVDANYKFWFLHNGLLSTFNICLYFIILYLVAHILSMKINNIIRYGFLCIFIFFSLMHINGNFARIVCMHSYKETKSLMYIVDKISLFYIKKGQNIILPKSLPFYIIPDIFPRILAENRDLNTLFYEKDRARYLIYVEHNYKVNVMSKVTFLPYKEAMQKYKELGGNFSEEELEKLDFSKIKESLNEN